MATITNSPASWVSVTSNQKQHINLWQKWLAVADGQAKNKAMWFAASLVIMGVLFLPLPAVLIYAYNAPTIVLIISMILFFANFIFGMGGSNIRVTLTLFVTSIIAYIIMAAICIL
jgi:hypothetical protein